MHEGLPRFSESARKGELGVNHVAQIVSDTFRWIFKRNHQEFDFGIDGQLEIVDEKGFVTGQIVAAQIKYGSSFLKEKNRWGYIYRGSKKHFNYLSNYPTPVIIIICDPESGESFWQQFKANETMGTDNGWKITIPFSQKFIEGKNQILEIVGPIKDNLSLLSEYWALNKLLSESSDILYAIDKPDILSLNTSDIRLFFDRIRSNKEIAFSCRGKVEISFSGYDKDPRELFEIEEVRRYVKCLNQTLSEFLFFVPTSKRSGTLLTFVTCLCDAYWLRPQWVDFDREKLAEFLTAHWPGLNQMTNWLGMTDEETIAITNAVFLRLGIDLSEMTDG
jgi:hypothetical protein